MTDDDEIEDYCERCGNFDCLRENHGTTINDGKWLCHDCELDARMEE